MGNFLQDIFGAPDAPPGYKWDPLQGWVPTGQAGGPPRTRPERLGAGNRAGQVPIHGNVPPAAPLPPRRPPMDGAASGVAPNSNPTMAPLPAFGGAAGMLPPDIAGGPGMAAMGTPSATPPVSPISGGSNPTNLPDMIVGNTPQFAGPNQPMPPGAPAGNAPLPNPATDPTLAAMMQRVASARGVPPSIPTQQFGPPMPTNPTPPSLPQAAGMGDPRDPRMNLPQGPTFMSSNSPQDNLPQGPTFASAPGYPVMSSNNPMDNLPKGPTFARRGNSANAADMVAKMRAYLGL